MITAKTYQVTPVFHKLTQKELTVSVPGSKSITNRALLLATLANGTSTLSGVLFSDDSRHFLQCVKDLGFDLTIQEASRTVALTGMSGALPLDTASINVGSAGTAARFLTAYLGISEGTWNMDSSMQMRKRPMAPLLSSLRELGTEIHCTEQEGFFPFQLKGHGFGASHISVDIANSSQFLSALLISSILAKAPLEIEVEGTHGMAYIDMTTKMMEQFGVKAMAFQREGRTIFKVPHSSCYQALNYPIEPDVSAACYFYAMAPLLGITVQVEGVTKSSLQGDIRFLDVLAQMGCVVEGTTVTGPENGVYSGVTVDMSSFSDQAITLAAIAPFATSPTRITGIGHIRYQESDRIHAIVTELHKMGILCDEEPDSITIYPSEPKASSVDTYEDHRMAMGFSLVGLRAPGIVINDPGCCRKTFEDYFETLDACVRELCSR